MTAVSELLDAAARTLAGDNPESNRVSCWFTRTALEGAVEARLTDRGFPTAGASMRSRLTCLRVAYASAPEVHTQAAYAWDRLSSACHQHAYELSPTYVEASHLLDIVRHLSTPSSTAKDRHD